MFERSTLTIATGTGNHRFSVEIARSVDQMELGLKHRRALPADGGMLFEYGRPQPVTLWMKDTLIPLDMVFIATDGRVVSVHQGAVPLSTDPIQSRGPARAALELNAGAVRALGIRPGDVVHHPFFGNTAR